MTDLATIKYEPLNVEEEKRVRDFYERRTTRLNMGPSVLIPRLLATLDAARALLADTPSVEPAGLDRLRRIEAAARHLLAFIDEPLTSKTRRNNARAALREALLPTQASDS